MDTEDERKHLHRAHYYERKITAYNKGERTYQQEIEDLVDNLIKERDDYRRIGHGDDTTLEIKPEISKQSPQSKTEQKKPKLGEPGPSKQKDKPYDKGKKQEQPSK